MARVKIGRNFWGPPVWDTIHIFGAAYEPEYRIEFKSFLYSMTKLLPCIECRTHLKRNLDSLPIDKYLETNDGAFLLTYVLHDLVNQQCNYYHPKEKKKVSPPLIMVKRYYYSRIGKECKSCRI